MNENSLDKVGKRLGNLSDLPDELKKQLQATKTDELERQILDVLSGLEGIGNIDEVLVGLYRKFSVIQERAFLSNKMYRMAKAGHLKSVKGKKGVYEMT
ncbi:MAG: hypothetical protein PHD48_12715 [Alphaproteobacteria bacterium]|nr:hypothetical protein [Alphaproteobacteria bacterium]